MTAMILVLFTLHFAHSGDGKEGTVLCDIIVIVM